MALSWEKDKFLIISIAVSILAHIILLSIKFLPDPRDWTPPKATMMAIIVNVKTLQKPKNATIMAQANHDGGGQSSEKNLTTSSPLPQSQKAQTEKKATQDAVEEAKQKVAQMEAEVQRMSELVKKSQWKVNPGSKSEVLSKAQQEEQRLAMELAARIDKQLSEYASRPKKVFVGASAIESDFAVWVDGWQKKVEEIGNQFYPEQAQGKTRGTLILTVGIKKNGSIESVKIDKSSGFTVLDAAAERIVKLSAPFTVFTPAMQKKADVLYITRQWKFGPSGLQGIEVIPGS